MGILGGLNDDDWTVIAAAPAIAAAVVSASDDTGKNRASEEEELAAFQQLLDDLPRKLRESELVTELVPILRAHDDPRLAHLASVFDFSLNLVHEIPLEEWIKRVKTAFRLVDRHASREEAARYKDFIYALSEAVARASREGMLLSNKISPQESFWLRQLRAAAKR